MNMKKLEEEKRKLENEVEILTSEKEYLQKSAEKVSTLQFRLETLKEIESRYQELKQEVSIDSLVDLTRSMKSCKANSPPAKSSFRTRSREKNSSDFEKTTERSEANWRL